MRIDEIKAKSLAETEKAKLKSKGKLIDMMSSDEDEDDGCLICTL